MAFLFGGGNEDSNRPHRKRDQVKDMQSQLRQSMRVVTRDSCKAKEQEKQLMLEIKQCAKANKYTLCNAKAKELVRTRIHQERLQATLGQMSGLCNNLSSISSTQVLQDCILKTGTLLQSLNKQTDVKKIMKMMDNYQVQSEQFSSKQEAVQETIDSVLETDNEATITENTVADVYLELGLDASLMIGMTPSLSSTHMAESLKSISVPRQVPGSC